MSRATSVEPVKIDAGDARIGDERRADRRRRGRAAIARRRRGTPARCSTRTASAAMSGVCSAGFASTGLPAASAALTCPVKIASGKFHGEIATIGRIDAARSAAASGIGQLLPARARSGRNCT